MNPEDPPEFRALRASGATPERVFLAAETRYGSMMAIRVVREVFGLSLTGAKEVMIRAHGVADSLNEHQQNLLPALEQALDLATRHRMYTPDVEAEISLLSPEQGGNGRPVFSGYRPQHKVRGNSLMSGKHVYIGCESLLPGQTVRGYIEFISPERLVGCLWVGREIDVQEGGRVVGRARITNILNKVLEKYDA
jgi:elongation factor Tu